MAHPIEDEVLKQYLEVVLPVCCCEFARLVGSRDLEMVYDVQVVYRLGYEPLQVRARYRWVLHTRSGDALTILRCPACGVEMRDRASDVVEMEPVRLKLGGRDG